jgi:hypothetical protein
LAAGLLLVAFLPNAVFIEHYDLLPDRDTAMSSAHDHHRGHDVGGNQLPSDPSDANQSTHCHVGPKSCSASSGLSQAIVLAAALSMFLLGGTVFALSPGNGAFSLFDLSRRLIVPPRRTSALSTA